MAGQSPNGQFDFLHAYVVALLDEHGLKGLSDEQKRLYVPQIQSLLEERIGLVMVPKLDKIHMQEFARLLDTPEVSNDQWKTFWYKAIPEFEQDMKKILVGFGQDVKQILSA